MVLLFNYAMPGATGIPPDNVFFAWLFRFMPGIVVNYVLSTVMSAVTARMCRRFEIRELCKFEGAGAVYDVRDW